MPVIGEPEKIRERGGGAVEEGDRGEIRSQCDYAVRAPIDTLAYVLLFFNPSSDQAKRLALLTMAT
jgi:hypothetical protein